MKKCTGPCGLIKPLTEFHKDSRIKAGVRSQCKTCQQPKRKLRHDPIRDRELKLKRRYGITPADYDRMVYNQNGKCKICKQPSKLVVDHCHTTGRVRGLLCDNCNTGIGLLGDSRKNLFSAIMYLS